MALFKDSKRLVVCYSVGGLADDAGTALGARHDCDANSCRFRSALLQAYPVHGDMAADDLPPRFAYTYWHEIVNLYFSLAKRSILE